MLLNDVGHDIHGLEELFLGDGPGSWFCHSVMCRLLS